MWFCCRGFVFCGRRYSINVEGGEGGGGQVSGSGGGGRGSTFCRYYPSNPTGPPLPHKK